MLVSPSFNLLLLRLTTSLTTLKIPKEILPLSILVVTIASSLFIQDYLAQARKQKQIDAYNSVVSSTYFEDTVLNYNLSSDSLILQFPTPPKHDYWIGEIFITKNKSDECIHIPMPDKPDGYLGKIPFINGKATFKNFQIPEDSLNLYSLKISAAPRFLNCRAIGDVYKPRFLFYSHPVKPKALKLNDLVEDFKITLFDLDVLKSLSPDLKQFCKDSITRAHSIKITDERIETRIYK